MLLEYWMTSGIVSRPYGWWSLIVHLPMRNLPFSQNTRSSGSTTPSSSAAAASTALSVEPGSKLSVTARLRRICGLALPCLFGSNQG